METKYTINVIGKRDKGAFGEFDSMEQARETLLTAGWWKDENGDNLFYLDSSEGVLREHTAMIVAMKKPQPIENLPKKLMVSV